MSDLTEEELVELERLRDAATPGHWRASTLSDNRPIVVSDTHGGRRGAAYTWMVADAEFIAAARNELPRLIAAARELNRLKSAMIYLEHGFRPLRSLIPEQLLEQARECGWKGPNE